MSLQDCDRRLSGHQKDRVSLQRARSLHTAFASFVDSFVEVFKHLDKVIHLIRTIENPKRKIMSLCKLSEKQYEAIINMRIRSLAKLQEQNIKKELDLIGINDTNPNLRWIKKQQSIL